MINKKTSGFWLVPKSWVWHDASKPLPGLSNGIIPLWQGNKFTVTIPYPKDLKPNP